MRLTVLSSSATAVNRAADFLGPLKPYLAVVGACSVGCLVARSTWAVLRGLTSYFLAGPLHLGVNFRKLTANGGWAVITGATDGLGLAFAKELAKRGVNVILVGRNAEKLDMVSREIEAQYHVKADMLVVDFRHASLEDYLKIKNKLAQIRVDVLVNNVGMTVNGSGPFGSHINTEQSCLDLLDVNLVSMLMFTNFVLPGMKERRKGVIVNLSSIAAFIPLPNYALYGSTKAMIDFFSACLYQECKGYGIHVQSLLPGPVLTNMTKNYGKSFFLVHAAPYARDSLSQVGLRRRTFGHWIHALMILLARPIPLWITLRLMGPPRRRKP